MHWMFFNCHEFNGDVREWQTGNVQDMSGMFYNATKFTEKLTGGHEFGDEHAACFN